MQVCRVAVRMEMVDLGSKSTHKGLNVRRSDKSSGASFGMVVDRERSSVLLESAIDALERLETD